MKETISQKLVNRLSYLDPEQMDSLIQRAKQLKKRSGTQADSLDSWIERVLRKEERSRQNATGQCDGVVVSVHATEVDVETSQGIERVLRGSHAVAPGDEVTVGMIVDQLTLLEVKPRRTKLSRPDVDYENKERIIVANVDIVGIVVSVVSPPLHPRLIDRYLVAIQNGGAQPMVCVNKIDLLEDPEELLQLAPYIEIGVPVINCSTQTGEGIEEIRNLVEGKTVAFVGHSGVGKSSLVNAFAPDLNLKTSGLMHGHGRGAHTTTVSSLHRLDKGTTLIDTPGIRSFGLWSASENELDQAFPEFEGLHCRFGNCTHTVEPGCALIEAVESGHVSASRYDTYLRLKEEIS